MPTREGVFCRGFCGPNGIPGKPNDARERSTLLPEKFSRRAGVECVMRNRAQTAEQQQPVEVSPFEGEFSAAVASPPFSLSELGGLCSAPSFSFVAVCLRSSRGGRGDSRGERVQQQQLSAFARSARAAERSSPFASVGVCRRQHAEFAASAVAATRGRDFFGRRRACLRQRPRPLRSPAQGRARPRRESRRIQRRRRS